MKISTTMAQSLSLENTLKTHLPPMHYLHRTLIVVLAISLILMVWKYFSLQQELKHVQETFLSTERINDKTLAFTKLFIQKVLKANGEIDFETRLQLENAVRDLNDPGILAAWQQFVQSSNETEAQEAVKNLLDLLVNKIHVQ